MGGPDPPIQGTGSHFQFVALDGRLKAGHGGFLKSYFFVAYGFFELRTEKRSGVPFSSNVSRKPFCR
jgi:hypothetical protein